MRWIEIINARMVADSFEHQEPEQIFHDIQASVDAGNDKQVRLMIYKNGLVENDWSIHLCWETDRQPPGKTELGIKLADIVRPIALLDHTIWVESRRNLQVHTLLST